MNKIKFLFFLIFISLFSLIPSDCRAQNEFAANVSVSYNVESDGITKVIHKISLENIFSNLYATSYGLVLDNLEPIEPKAYQDGRELKLLAKKEGEKTTLEVSFDDAIVGKGKSRNFEISFKNSSFAQRTGEVWEISIPRLGNSSSFRSYQVSFSIPSSFGNEAYISPKPTQTVKIDNRNYYYFDKESIAKTGVVAGFGSFQVFSFTLNYHIENPLNKTAYTNIAIPPDTSLQKVYYKSLNPLPSNIEIDSDGNWIAMYILKPRERIDILAIGNVQIFAGQRPFPKSSDDQLNLNLQHTEFWQKDNLQIKELADKLKTPKNIYDFVTETLKYDYDRVKPNVVRLGAINALNNPTQAICMEFTDLFISLARAAGIPAREINGYAYTENPKVQPLSLVNDVLHSWPEYWDYEKKTWTAIDPTWGSTTSGIDFFNKLDLRHFTFVIHGKDPVIPYPPGSYKLGDNPQKDVFVNFGQLPEDRSGHIKINIQTNKFIPFFDSELYIELKNEGPAAIYDLKPIVYFDDKVAKSDRIEIMPPFSSYQMKINIPFSFLGKNTPNVVKIQALEKEVEISTFKNMVILYSLLALFIIIIIFIIFLIIKFKKLPIFKFWHKITILPLKIYGKIFNKFKKDKNLS